MVRFLITEGRKLWEEEKVGLLQWFRVFVIKLKGWFLGQDCGVFRIIRIGFLIMIICADMYNFRAG
jgi:hypothetical protein